MSQHEDVHEEGLTHRQAMGDQHSPLITGICAVAIAWAAASGAAKEIGYRDARHMLADAWGKVVAIALSKGKATPVQTLAPK